MLTATRQEHILQILETEGSVRVSKLKEIFNISESTIRRDINDLDNLGKLTKVFGGAISLNKNNMLTELSVEEKKDLNIENKTHIAKYAATLITPNDLVYIDAGTTTHCMLNFIKEYSATYVTNAISHALTLSKLNFNVVLIGGSIRHSTEAIVGTEAIMNLRKYNFSKAFFGTNGIDINQGFITPDINEASTKNMAISQCSQKGRFCLADNSKFNLTGGISFLEIDSATIITNYDFPQFSDKTTIIVP